MHRINIAGVGAERVVNRHHRQIIRCHRVRHHRQVAGVQGVHEVRADSIRHCVRSGAVLPLPHHRVLNTARVQLNLGVGEVLIIVLHPKAGGRVPRHALPCRLLAGNLLQPVHRACRRRNRSRDALKQLLRDVHAVLERLDVVQPLLPGSGQDFLAQHRFDVLCRAAQGCPVHVRHHWLLREGAGNAYLAAPRGERGNFRIGTLGVTLDHLQRVRSHSGVDVLLRAALLRVEQVHVQTTNGVAQQGAEVLQARARRVHVDRDAGAVRLGMPGAQRLAQFVARGEHAPRCVRAPHVRVVLRLVKGGEDAGPVLLRPAGTVLHPCLVEAVRVRNVHLQPEQATRAERALLVEMDHRLCKITTLRVRQATIIPATSRVEVHREPVRAVRFLRRLQEGTDLTNTAPPLAQLVVVRSGAALPAVEHCEFFFGCTLLDPLSRVRKLGLAWAFDIRHSHDVTTRLPHTHDCIAGGGVQAERDALQEVPGCEHLRHLLGGERLGHCCTHTLAELAHIQQRGRSLAADAQVSTVREVRPRVGRADHARFFLADEVAHVRVRVPMQERFNFRCEYIRNGRAVLVRTAHGFEQARLVARIHTELPNLHHFRLGQTQFEGALEHAVDCHVVQAAQVPEVTGALFLHLIVHLLHVQRVHGLGLANADFEFPQLAHVRGQVLDVHMSLGAGAHADALADRDDRSHVQRQGTQPLLVLPTDASRLHFADGLKLVLNCTAHAPDQRVRSWQFGVSLATGLDECLQALGLCAGIGIQFVLQLRFALILHVYSLQSGAVVGLNFTADAGHLGGERFLVFLQDEAGLCGIPGFHRSRHAVAQEVVVGSFVGLQREHCSFSSSICKSARARHASFVEWRMPSVSKAPRSIR